MISHLLGLLILTVCDSHAARPAIVGEDDRKEWFEVADARLRELGRSTAVLIPKKDQLLEKTATGYRLVAGTPTHGEQDKLCPGETFSDQPSPGFCTTFLVAPDILATAGHCMEHGCESAYFVFDFLKKSAGSATTSFTGDQVFECERVLDIDKNTDWALVKLRRFVPGRAPFRLRASGEPALATPLAVLGYPRGLPLKIAAGAKVEENQNAEDIYFEANLDTFGGNSGSPVVNAVTHEVEGIFDVGFGELDEDADLVTGTTCRRLARRTEAEATPGWVSRTSNFRNAVAKWAMP